jgi:glutamate dehydrogenase/leucine dehydrogenase
MFADENPKDIKVAIQGFGNVGSHLAELLSFDGFKIVAVSDSTAGVYLDEGLDIKKLVEFKNNGGRFLDLPAGKTGWTGQGEKISSEEVLFVEADILAPSALGGVITKENVSNIKARTIVEMANSPTTSEAENFLNKNGVKIIPDILANAGGVIVSYFEWEQNRKNESWGEEDVNAKLQKMILEAFEKVQVKSKEKNISLREASYAVALERILKTAPSN